ncbi:MAG: histidine kinase [Microscillaceae bacterium]|nr:histidine kinase [Microscillaceae bacterium]
MIQIKKSHLIALNVSFWIGYVVFLTAIFAYTYKLEVALSHTLINAIFHAIVIYTNVFVLIPRFLEKKKFWLYGLLGLLMILGLTYLRLNISTPINIPILLRNSVPMGSRVLFGVLFLPFLSVFFLSLTYKMTEGWLQNLSTQTNLKNQQLEAELKFLRTQINPHFLFNTLNNIYTLCLLKEDSAAPMVLKLSQMMRYMLYECREDLVELTKEIAFLENYIELQRLKTDKTQNICFEVKGNPSHLKIAPMILLSFVENCFKHGNIDSDEAAWVCVDIELVKNALYLQISNSIGSTVRKIISESGIGLQNTRRRLELIYPKRHALEVIPQENQFTVKLSLELDE